MRFRALFAILTILAVAACGGSSTSPSSNSSSGSSSSSGSGSSGGTGTTSPNGSVTFKIDGAQHTATSTVSASYTSGILSLGATDPARTTTIGLAVMASTTGTYTLGPLSATNATLFVGNPAQGWQAGVGFGSGNVTLTTLTPTNAVGTFTFTMVPAPGTGSTGNKSVTEGSFNVTIR